MIKVRLLLVAALLVLALAVPQAAWAASGTNNCFGVVTSQRASTAHDIGQHVSGQATPHQGLGNVARSFDLSVGELGAFLATIDNDPNTHCP